MFDYAVVGLGKTGQALLDDLTLRYPQSKILASDLKPLNNDLGALQKKHPNVVFEFGGHTQKILKSKLVIKSPGVASTLALLNICRGQGIPVMSEMDFAFKSFASKPKGIVGVTGTNGKTTTTDLLGRLLSSRMPSVIVAGNIGNPLIESVQRVTKDTYLVLELSSYQLEDSQGLALDAAILLNITPDHLQRHGSFASYAAAKHKIFTFVDRGLAVMNAEDEFVSKAQVSSLTSKVFFSSGRTLEEGAWVESEKIEIKTLKGAMEIKPSPNLLGLHNLENQMAALLTAQSFGLEASALQKVLDEYQAPPHRLETLGETSGVLFINDSKATNVASTLVALAALKKTLGQRKGKIRLLLGGQDKGSPYTPLLKFTSFIGSLHVFGEAKEKIFSELGLATCSRHQDLDEACRAAFKAARPGDIVLLSPACASFDQFRNFEHRGDVFRDIFNALKKSRV